MPHRPLAFLLTVLLLLTSQPADAQHAASPLHDEIAAADSVLFAAFNARDIETLETMFTDDLEFYHDKSGLTGYEENMRAFARLFSRDDGLQRELVDGSLEVYPVPNYGAMAVGEHRFCHVEAGVEDCGTFPFATVWRQEGGSWKVARTLSYGH